MEVRSHCKDEIGQSKDHTAMNGVNTVKMFLIDSKLGNRVTIQLASLEEGAAGFLSQRISISKKSHTEHAKAK